MFGLMLSTGAIAGTVLLGVFLRGRRPARPQRLLATLSALSAGTVLTGALLALFGGSAFAAEAGALSAAAGSAMIGAGIATGLACLGAGYAVSGVGSAALGLVGEKPEALGTTLIYVGLAEGIAIYGVIVSLLILGKI